jgi:ATP-dependent Zn protease
VLVDEERDLIYTGKRLTTPGDPGVAILDGVERLLHEADERANMLLTSHRDALERLVAVLLERETVDGEDVMRILDGDGARGARTAPPRPDEVVRPRP